MLMMMMMMISAWVPCYGNGQAASVFTVV